MDIWGQSIVSMDRPDTEHFETVRIDPSEYRIDYDFVDESDEPTVLRNRVTDQIISLEREEPYGVDLSQLDLRFLPYYLSGEKVEVEWGSRFRVTGHRIEHNVLAFPKTRFFIGIGNVFTPRFTQLKRANSTHGFEIISDNVDSVMGLGVIKKQYQDVDPVAILLGKLKEIEGIIKCHGGEVRVAGILRSEIEKYALERFNMDVSEMKGETNA